MNPGAPTAPALRGVCLLAPLALLVACSATPERDSRPSTPIATVPEPTIEIDGPPPVDIDIEAIANPVPRTEPPSRYGNPESYEVHGKRYRTLRSSAGFVQRGIASWYGNKFHGRRTSSGERYDMYQMTAAHTQLPLPSYAEVTNLENGRSVVVRVNDRGPFHSNRVMDLSYVAARKLDMIGKGTAMVEIRAVSSPAEVRRARLAAAQRAAAPASRPEIYLQVGAFQSRDNADALRARLLGRLSAGVRVLESDDAGVLMFRVQVGPVADAPAADVLVAELARIGIAEHQLVTN